VPSGGCPVGPEHGASLRFLDASIQEALRLRPSVPVGGLRLVKQRFLDARNDPYAFAVFGGSIRRCLGMAFALSLLRVAVATVLRRTELAIVAPHARPARQAFFVAPEAGLQVRCTMVRGTRAAEARAPYIVGDRAACDSRDRPCTCRTYRGRTTSPSIPSAGRARCRG